ncbi:MAG: winged helix-turn-helix domain-containing protein [Brevundimonas sp.]
MGDDQPAAALAAALEGMRHGVQRLAWARRQEIEGRHLRLAILVPPNPAAAFIAVHGLKSWGPSLVIADMDAEGAICLLELGAAAVASSLEPPALLAHRAHALLRLAPTSAAVVWSDWRLDRQERRLRGPQGDWLALGEIDTAVLELLLSRRGSVVYQREISNCIGECSSEEAARMAARVRVSRLRRKIIAAFGTCPISTARGRGYRFASPPAPDAVPREAASPFRAFDTSVGRFDVLELKQARTG